MDETKVKELETRVKELERNKWDFTMQERVMTVCMAVLTFLASCVFITTIIAIIKVIVSK